MTHMIWGNTTEIFVTILHTLILLIKKYYLDFHDLRTFVAICFHWDVHIFWHCLGLKSDFRQFYDIQNLMSNHVPRVKYDRKGKYPPGTRSRISIPDNTWLIQYMVPIPAPDPNFFSNTQIQPDPKLKNPTRQPLVKRHKGGFLLIIHFSSDICVYIVHCNVQGCQRFTTCAPVLCKGETHFV